MINKDTVINAVELEPALYDLVEAQLRMCLTEALHSEWHGLAKKGKIIKYGEITFLRKAERAA